MLRTSARLATVFGVHLLGCAHLTPEQAQHAADERDIRVAAYGAFLHGSGSADKSPVVNCLAQTKIPTNEPPRSDNELEDASPEVLRALDGRPQLVTPYSACRRPPLTVGGKTVGYAVRLEIESIERLSADTAIVSIGVIPLTLDGKFGIFYGEGWQLRLQRGASGWVEIGREPGWAT